MACWLRRGSRSQQPIKWDYTQLRCGVRAELRWGPAFASVHLKTVSSNKSWLAAVTADSFFFRLVCRSRVQRGKLRHRGPAHTCVLAWLPRPFRSFHRVCFDTHAVLSLLLASSRSILHFSPSSCSAVSAVCKCCISMRSSLTGRGPVTPLHSWSWTQSMLGMKQLWAKPLSASPPCACTPVLCASVCVPKCADVHFGVFRVTDPQTACAAGQWIIW